MIEILYQDEHLVAINKPSGILVHLTRLSEDQVSVTQLLREQLGTDAIYPTHRLDRATSGVLLFARTTAAASWVGERLMDRQWDKKYLAVVRGFLPEGLQTIDSPLSDAETGKVNQPAITHYRSLGQVELPWTIGLKYVTSRFSVLEVEPETGRRQQIRKHLSHIRHPVLNDKRHGDVKYTTWFRDNGLPTRMLLHAHRLTFPHPELPDPVQVTAPWGPAFEEALQRLELRAFVEP
jgi:tRNA pseudouridine65 synthase